MSSEKFENLEDDFSTSLDKIRPSIDGLTSLSGEQRKNAVRQSERQLEEANFILQEMEGEAKVAPVQYRTQMLSRLRSYRRDLEQLSQQLQKKKDYGLGAGANYGFNQDERLEASQRARLLQGAQSLQRTSESVARSQQISAETDQVGTEILGELGRQREVLVRTKDKLQGTDENLGKSRKIMKTMAMRMMTNKMVLIIIILLELGILGLIVYLKFFK